MKLREIRFSLVTLLLKINLTGIEKVSESLMRKASKKLKKNIAKVERDLFQVPPISMSGMQCKIIPLHYSGLYRLSVRPGGPVSLREGLGHTCSWFLE